MSWDTEWGIVIEAFPEPGHGGFGLGYLDEQDAWRARACHGARQYQDQDWGATGKGATPSGKIFVVR